MSKKGTSAGNEISEDIVLELRTNFEEELRRSATQYSNFQKKAGDVSRSLEQNVNSMFRQVSGNLSSMMNGVQRTVVSSVNLTRGAMREIMADSVKLSQTYENYLKRSEVIKKGMLDTLDRIPKASGKMAAINAWQNVGNPFDKETVRAASDMYFQLGNISKKASTNILQATQDSLNSVKQLVIGTKNTLVDLEVAVNNKGTLESALSAKSGIEKVEKQLKSGQDAIKEQAKRVVVAEKEVQNARLAMSKQTDDKLKAQQHDFLMQAVQNLTKVQKAYADTEKEVAKLSNQFEEAKKRISKEISSVVTQISNSTQVKNSRGLFENIDKAYNNLAEKYKKLSNTKLLKREVVEQFKADVKSMNESIHAYNINLKNIRENIFALEKLHKAGLAPNAAPLIKERKEQLKELEANVKQITAMSNKATNQSELLARRQSKSLFATSWEMVRNFRWQVAGLIYLASKATSTIRNTFFKVLDDIQKFRTDSMAIAASITYSMIGDVSQNFNKAFEYSKDLMMKLEMEAAKTILTLEDMTMLTKTFVQAGIIPNTDEDVKKISTIGTAIKILTEGMANAGVQMRQELYAIIQGRQRATDQVAMMFKMIGININDTLKKAKKEGKDLLDVLSEALVPFNEVNKSMAHDYSVQLEALQKIWDKIKRIGAENTFKEFSASMERFNASLADVDTGKLTEDGRQWAFYLGMAMETMRLIVKELGNIISSLSGAADKTSSWLIVFRGIHGAVWGISSLIKMIAVSIHAMISSVVGLTASLVTLATDGPKAAWQVLKEMAKDVTDKFKSVMDGNIKAFDDINNSAEALNKTLEDTQINANGLDNIFNTSLLKAAEDISKIDKDIESVTKQSLDGVAKINYEYQLGLKKTEDAAYSIAKAIDAINVEIKKSGNDPKKNKQLNEMLQGQKEAMGKIDEYRRVLLARKTKEEGAFYDEQKRKIEQVKVEYENLLESFEVAPKTPFEELGKKYDKLTISLEHFIEKNKKALTGGQIKNLWGTFEKGVNDSIDSINEDFENVYTSFYESMSSHRVLNPLAAIDNEFNKIIKNINKSTTLMDDPTRRDALLKELEIMREERKALAELTMELEKQEALAEAKKSYADVLKLSIRPIDQQKAALMDLEGEYIDSVANIKKKIDEINKKWKGMDLPPVIQDHIIYLEQQMENLGVVFEQHKKDIQEPFWKDLKDMAQGWADSFTDVLNEAAFNLDSFKGNFRNFITDIAKDASRAWIKRNITDNIMNLLPDFSGRKKSEEGTEENTNFITSFKAVFDKIVIGIKGVGEWFTKALEDPFTAIVDAFSGLLNWVTGIFSGGFSGGGGGVMSYSDNAAGSGAMWSQLGGMVLGMLGGGGGDSGGSNGSNTISSGGFSIDASNYGLDYGGALDGMAGWNSFASGGWITEPVIGKGLRTGENYSFGEKESEFITPRSKMNGSGGVGSLLINIPITVEGNANNKLLGQLRNELESVVKTTTLRVIKEQM